MSPDVAALVRARLLAQAHASGEEFERTLVRFAVERWLFRLGTSAARNRCVLKGASLLTLWLPDPHRSTRDIDLLTSGDADDSAIRALIAEVCAIPCPEDGIVFDVSDLALESIRAEEEYTGVRGLFWARLGAARIRMQVDIAFGDAITSDPEETEYPVFLQRLPPGRIRAYPRVTIVAEKSEVMVKLEIRNSRMKDFHDVCALAAAFAFDGVTLRAALVACFDRRGTPWTAERPVALTPAFYQHEDPQKHWQAYLRSGGILVAPPARYEEVGEQIIGFLAPVRDSIVAGDRFEQKWTSQGEWTALRAAR
jgi:nucleotidyltransferase AbiEii toxin of type IV toxin-antitoxin system